ncbi:MAG TPA: hypothetical protein VLQ45_33170 [Thermoanaerobaculia bacterium]|nr:hypothetical protein [Thermoanaerobaculia bacterium]
MSTKMTRMTTILIAFAVLFTLTSVAEASGFASPRAPRLEAPVSLVDMAGEWLTSLWTGMTQIFEKDGALGGGDPTTSACTNPNGCGDAGWGIDPNG